MYEVNRSAVEVSDSGDDMEYIKKMIACMTLQSTIDSVLDSIHNISNIEKILLRRYKQTQSGIYMMGHERINTVGIKSSMIDDLRELDDVYNTVCMK